MDQIKLQNKFFTAVQITPTATRIAGMGGELCYLVEGTERALLIDGLTGVGSLKAFVRELTELTVIMAATHGHIDHTGAGWEFGELFMNPDDIALMYQDEHCKEEKRLNFVKFAGGPNVVHRTEPVLCDVPIPHALKTYPVYEGNVFDLGGTKLEVIQVPGHTYGTIVLLNREERVVFSGDACNVNTLLCLEGSTTVEEYLESLRHFATFTDSFDGMYGGHGEFEVPVSAIYDAIAMCERILEGTDEKIEAQSIDGSPSLLGSARKEDFMPLCGGWANIMYSKDMIRKRNSPVIKGRPNLYK